jgi:hypothetical protein
MSTRNLQIIIVEELVISQDNKKGVILLLLFLDLFCCCYYCLVSFGYENIGGFRCPTVFYHKDLGVCQ